MDRSETDRTEPNGAAPDANALTVYTTEFCGDCTALKRALDAMDLPYREIDLATDPDAEAYVLEVNDGRRSVPTVAYRGAAESLSNFSKRRLDGFLAEVGLRPGA